jgi:phosphatidylglycerol lysyltransferase
VLFVKKLWKQIWAWVQARLTLLKVLFVLSVLVFVVIEVGRIAKDLNGSALKASLATQSPTSVIAMVLLGLVAVVPMLNYDFTITTMLPGHFTRREVIKSGWIVNTFTNIAGFGGFLGASLRANFYHRGASRKEILLAISKIALFLLAGLSLWSVIALGLIFGFGIGRMYQDYWLWLIGGAAYFPGLMLVTHLSRREFFADLPLRRQLRLTLGSFLEWGGCAGFFLVIGHFLAVPGNLWDFLPLFLIANVLGVLSMMPGGLGSFDVFMIFGLGQMGLDNNLAVVWLLFYRLFYYVIPFLIGALLFAQDAGKQLNQTLEGLPLLVLRRLGHAVLVLFLYFTAIMLLLRGVVPDIALRNALYLRLYPFTFLFLSRVTNIVMAFVIFGFARGIANKVRKAYWPTIAILVVACIASLRQEAGWHFVAFVVVILIAAFLARGELTRQRMDFPWGNRLIDGTIFGFTALFYAIALFYNAPGLHHQRVPLAFFFPSERMWVTTAAGVLMAAATLGVIYRYLSTPQPALGLGDKTAIARVQAVIARSGGTEFSQLVFTGDKLVRFYQVAGVDRVCFLFRKKTDKLMILGEPIGDPADWPAAIADFMQAADAQGLSLVFYEVSEALTMQLHEYGFDFMKFGESGVVDLTEFTLAGSKRKGERALMHKFDREGYRFEWLQPPFTPALLTELRAVSDSWLNGRPEKGFSLGFFDADYLNQAPIGVIRDAQGQIVAFANAMPMAPGTASVDLMRSRADAPSGIMDAVFINLFQQALADGQTRFDLGMAPLSNVGLSGYAFFEERLAHLVYEYGYRFYGFQGLRSYKEKYVTTWSPRYVAYRKRSSLLFTLLQLLLLVNQTTAKRDEWPRRFGVVTKLDEWFQRNTD